MKGRVRRSEVAESRWLVRIGTDDMRKHPLELRPEHDPSVGAAGIFLRYSGSGIA